MSISFVHSKGADAPITIPAIGLDLFVRMTPAASGGAFSIIETINAPGKGPPRHRHREAEIFRVLEGRYLYEMDGRRFFAETGDVVSIPGGSEHGFVNVTDRPARQYISSSFRLSTRPRSSPSLPRSCMTACRTGSRSIASAPNGRWNFWGRR
jgi:quercetin dioxygenase-like cupin family protein